MPKDSRRTDLSRLVKKYQGLSVVDEIEHDLLNADWRKLNVSELFPSDLYDERNYHLELYSSLEESLRRDGFLIPLIIVRREAGGYEILNGVKRFLLGKKIGLKEIPCVLAELEPVRKIMYIMENILLEKDNSLVKTHAFLTLGKNYGYTDNDISTLSHLSLNQVRNLKRLASLPDFLKEALRSNSLTYSEARTLLGLSEAKQQELYQKIQKQHLSVRDLEKEKRNLSGSQRKRKVTIHDRSITIHFASEEEAKKFYPRIESEFSE